MELILKATALTYLLTRLLVDHEGPFGLFSTIRYVAGINVPIMALTDTGEQVATGDYDSNGSLPAKVLTCVYCASVYVSFVVALGLWWLIGLETVFQAAALWLVSCGLTWFAFDLAD